MTPSSPQAPPPFLWWIVWAGITTAFAVVFLVVPAPEVPDLPAAIRYVPLLPLAASFVVRWLVLPRQGAAMPAFVSFIVGLTLAEGAGITGIFLVPDLRETYFVLGLLGIFLHAPFFARRFQR